MAFDMNVVEIFAEPNNLVIVQTPSLVIVRGGVIG
jgi:hypothetical protein